VRIAEYDVPDALKYSKEHEWLKVEGNNCRIGITDYAQKILHEVVYVDLPPLGKNTTFMESLGTVESVKAVSDVYSPVSGEVMERNERLDSEPELVNKDPYGEGWIVMIKPSQLSEDLNKLMDAGAYIEFLKQIINKTTP
jgi:glycine cleavage system H protein